MATWMSTGAKTRVKLRYAQSWGRYRAEARNRPNRAEAIGRRPSGGHPEGGIGRGPRGGLREGLWGTPSEGPCPPRNVKFLLTTEVIEYGFQRSVEFRLLLRRPLDRWKDVVPVEALPRGQVNSHTAGMRGVDPALGAEDGLAWLAESFTAGAFVHGHSLHSYTTTGPLSSALISRVFSVFCCART